MDYVFFLLFHHYYYRRRRHRHPSKHHQHYTYLLYYHPRLSMMWVFFCSKWNGILTTNIYITFPTSQQHPGLNEEKKVCFKNHVVCAFFCYLFDMCVFLIYQVHVHVLIFFSFYFVLLWFCLTQLMIVPSRCALKT